MTFNVENPREGCKNQAIDEIQEVKSVLGQILVVELWGKSWGSNCVLRKILAVKLFPRANPGWSIYGVGRTIVGPSLYIWPAQITQSYAGDCPSNTVDCQTLQISLTKTYNRRFLANPTDKYARQWSSSPPAWSSTGSHICQLDLLGIADYIVFGSEICNVCANLQYWSDNHLHTIE